jgi:light-regulated signal transduction histidine kinase (bacteriophytochrome)
MGTIDEIRQQLNFMLASLDEREQAIAQAAEMLTESMFASMDKREQAIAQAAEMLTESAAVQAAWHQGAASERDRVVMLIDHRLDQLKCGGTNDALVLKTLRRTVLEAEE